MTASDEGQICYNETFCQDQMCLRTGCRLRNHAMTRDAALEEAALLAIKAADFGFHSSMIAAAIRALKSKPAMLNENEAAAFESLKRWRDGGVVSITYNAGDTAFATHVIAILAIIDRLTGAKSC